MSFAEPIYGRPSDEEVAAFYLRHDNVWLPEPAEPSPPGGAVR
jgi:hypothetical protein